MADTDQFANGILANKTQARDQQLQDLQMYGAAFSKTYRGEQDVLEQSVDTDGEKAWEQKHEHVGQQIILKLWEKYPDNKGGHIKFRDDMGDRCYPETIAMGMPDGTIVERSIPIEDVRDWGAVDAVLMAVDSEMRVGNADSNVNHIAPSPQNHEAVSETVRLLRLEVKHLTEDYEARGRIIEQQFRVIEGKEKIIESQAAEMCCQAATLELALKKLDDLHCEVAVLDTVTQTDPTPVPANPTATRKRYTRAELLAQCEQSPLGNALAAASRHGTFMDDVRPVNMLKGGR